MAEIGREIVWTDNVLDEIDRTVIYYDERNDSTRYSTLLLNKFNQAMEQAALFPLSGHSTEYPHVRYFVVVPNYSLFYHFNDKTITVLVLWDNRREPSRLAYALRNCAPHYLNEAAVPYGKE